MTWAAVAVVAAGAVAGGVSANSANKKAKSANGEYDKLVEYARLHPDAFGEKLDWKNINYKPLYPNGGGYADTAAKTIAGNQANFGAASALAGQTNDWINAGQQQRLNQFDPSFMDSYGQNAQNTANLLRGEIPQEDMGGIISRRTQQQALSGANTGGQQVAADLGLTRMGLMQQGAQQLGQNANIYSQLFPQGSYVKPDSMFVDVDSAIARSLQENQFAYQAQLNERNQRQMYAAIPDPYQAGIMELLGTRAGVKAGNPGQSVGAGAFTGGLQAYAGYLGSTGNLYGGQSATPAYSQDWTQPSAGYNGQVRKMSDRPAGLY